MLNISIVLYHPKWEQEVIPLVQELLRVRCLRKIYLLDNTAPEYRKAEIAKQKETLAAQFGTDKLRYMAMSENLGYGWAHNIALRESAYYRTEFHLVMNSDIRVKAEDIDAMCERMGKEGVEHYEVSNFALPGRESKHNSSYWDGTPYIGVGAGAHSYIGHVRSWNPNDLNAYISGTYKRESEILTEEDLYNESIMLGLRTKRGVLEPTTSQSRANYERLIVDGLLNRTPEGRIVATQKGIHILNRIIEELMI